MVRAQIHKAPQSIEQGRSGHRLGRGRGWASLRRPRHRGGQAQIEQPEEEHAGAEQIEGHPPRGGRDQQADQKEPADPR